MLRRVASTPLILGDQRVDRGIHAIKLVPHPGSWFPQRLESKDYAMPWFCPKLVFHIQIFCPGFGPILFLPFLQGGKLWVCRGLSRLRRCPQAIWSSLGHSPPRLGPSDLPQAMIKIMGGRSLKLLCAFLMLFLHLKSALAFTSGLGDDSVKCIEKEREALLEFKKGFAEGYQGKLSSWGNEDEKNCCNWDGIYCNNQTGNVLELKLGLYGLRGIISPSLLELPYLTSLDLSYNDFNQSHIPKFIGSIGNLKHLNLSWANLNGPIPHQLGNLSLLQNLHLNNNDLKIVENLEWLSRLSSIKELDLSSINLNMAKDWLRVVSRLPKLSNLNLASCDLPPVTDLSSLPHINFSMSLTILDLSTNHVTQSIFPWLFNFSTNLVQIDLSDNQLGGSIPDAFGNMNSLQTLILDDNQLEGGIPKFVGNMCALATLSMENNKLSGKLAELIHYLSGCSVEGIRNPSVIQSLRLGSNLLEGEISEQNFSALPELNELSLSHNSLTLKFSNDWVPPFQLVTIDLSSCNLGPDFPKWLSTQWFLRNLDISRNGISDSIPLWFWKQTTVLFYINLSYNQIRSGFPDKSFFPIPDKYGQPQEVENPGLTILNLSNNKFSGSLNYFLCSYFATSLIYLDFSNNQLSGGLPNCFMQCQNLIVLNLANNNLSGEIPSFTTSLIKLRVLDLSNNNFLGELPWSLRNCKRLSFLNLRDNSFSGKLPAWIGESLSSLVILNLHSNKFHGCIQLQLCWLAHIQFLDLSQNNISGNIPQCIYNLTAMAFKNTYNKRTIITHLAYLDGTQVTFLNGGRFIYVFNTNVSWKGHSYNYGKNFGEMRSIDLSSNKLTGEIPAEIFSLTELKTLNLAGNMLTGLIPQDIGRLQQLESLDLSSNQLFGSIPASIVDLNFLSFMNLSYNKLSGRIPTGTQIQIANPLGFIGNLALCGPPLTPKCPGDAKPNVESPKGGSKNYQEDEDEFLNCLYIGMGLGFIVGFWGVCGSLMLNRSWRHLYFQTISNLNDWLQVAMIVNIARMQRMFQG
uniref:Leucine-rich repeat-containing N-terminal plant-type domain-containing protein n=1 Tax=Quercus lobata TaxID=97700 RepID=A0A7N2MI88_QUELO